MGDGLMGKLWGYVRVSTSDQENSVKNQIEKINELAAKEKLTVAQIFVDPDVTARIPLRNRPQGRLLWDSMDPGDTLVFNKVDRVFRSVADASDTVQLWLERGIRCVILDLGIDLATPAGRMFFHQLASFAQFEREMIGQRTREIAAFLKKHGRPYGSARPFGWLKQGAGRDAQFSPCESERRLAERVAEMRDEGQSYRDIGWTLMKEKVTKPGRRATDNGKGVWYSVTEIHSLAQSYRLGFPIAARSALLADATPATLSGCSAETPPPGPRSAAS
jgi:DNA invertase Pin-like site-specific DNA recombinase